MNPALIFANGEPCDGPMVQRILHATANPYVIAADGGARVAAYFGFWPNMVIGDMDSLPSAQLRDLQARGVIIERHPPEKNETDLELALLWAVNHGQDWLRIIGGTGGRFDQMIANVYLMALPQLAGCDVELVAGNQSLRLLQAGTYTLNGETGDTVSLIPIGGDVFGITTHNLKYPLHNETLYFGPARGISNEMLTPQALITHQTGMLLCVHTVGKAD